MNGRRIDTKGGKIAMGEDYSIGYVMTNISSGQEYISDDIGIKGLAQLLESEKEDV